jgi:hypothetical protein
MPQTIQDAITLTFRLHNRYLWIDSLCLEQDNWSQKHIGHSKKDYYRSAAFSLRIIHNTTTATAESAATLKAWRLVS